MRYGVIKNNEENATVCLLLTEFQHLHQLLKV